MSRTARGSIQTQYPFKFFAKFVLDEYEYQLTFNGDSNSSLPRFYTGNVTLKYDDVAQLHGVGNFTGSLRDKDFTVTLDNGPIISGVLDSPVYTGRDFAGNGIWTST